MAKADKRKGAARRRGERPDRGGAAPSGQRAEHWKQEPDEHDYPAAHDYLSLLLGDTDAGHVVKALEGAAVVHRKAKDLLRASRLQLLGPEDPEVLKDLGKVNQGERLSPVLLVRGDLGSDVAMTVADGYHRICASYHLDEDADIPCRIADPPRPRPATPRTSATRPDGVRRSAPVRPKGAEEGD
ncbi:MAG TPA: hypothetical protein VMD28_05345 [Acidimicrobiales bacterium]|nr:hypothetical protein [Acidimicrobiales bacterium]